MEEGKSGGGEEKEGGVGERVNVRFMSKSSPPAKGEYGEAGRGFFKGGVRARLEGANPSGAGAPPPLGRGGA